MYFVSVGRKIEEISIDAQHKSLKIAHCIRFNHLQVTVLSFTLTYELHRLVLYSTKPNHFVIHIIYFTHQNIRIQICGIYQVYCRGLVAK